MPVDSDQIYEILHFPEPPQNRPYAYIDMVTTIDGKILSGGRSETVVDLGSKRDHELVKRIEAVSDAVLVGAETVRATSSKWNPIPRLRFVVSKSGNLPYEAAFFEGEPHVVTTEDANLTTPSHVKVLASGQRAVDFSEMMSRIRSMGVERLFVLGGSKLNGELIRHRLIDELFLTIAPKVKLGDDVPTYAGGAAFSRTELPSFDLVECHVVASEVFLRYRRNQRSGGAGQ